MITKKIVSGSVTASQMNWRMTDEEIEERIKREKEEARYTPLAVFVGTRDTVIVWKRGRIKFPTI